MALYRVEMHLTGFTGAPGLAVHYLDEIGGTAAQAANAVGNLWIGFQSFLYDTVAFENDAQVKIINEATGALEGVTGVTVVPGSGTNTTEPMPPSQMGLVRWHTAGVVGGRVLQGRTFVGPTTQDANDSGVLTSAAVADLQAAADAYIASANAEPVIWHRPSSGGSDGTARAITTASVWNQWAVLRGRRD